MTSRRPFRLMSGLATAASVGALFLWSPTGAAEFHFVGHDAGDTRAVQ